METNDRFLAIAKKDAPKKKVLLHSLLAFLCGAVLGLVGQGEYDLLTKVAGFDAKRSGMLISITFIALAAILTLFGFYKKVGQIFGAGLFIPITGFANSMVSSALEYRFEGPIFGVGSKLFSLAGSVITYGVVGSFLYGVIVFFLALGGVKI